MHFWDANLVLSPGSRYLLLQTLQTLPAFVNTYQAMECFLHLGFHRLRNSNTWHYDGVLYWLYIYIHTYIYIDLYWSILTILYLYCTTCTIIIHNHYIQYYNQLFECFSMYTVHGLERSESMNPVLRLFNVSNPTGQLGFEDWQSLYVDLSRYVRIKMFLTRNFDLFGASYQLLSALVLPLGITNWNSTIPRILPWHSVEASEDFPQIFWLVDTKNHTSLLLTLVFFVRFSVFLFD